jgi:hypothetical protein
MLFIHLRESTLHSGRVERKRLWRRRTTVFYFERMTVNKEEIKAQLHEKNNQF